MMDVMIYSLLVECTGGQKRIDGVEVIISGRCAVVILASGKENRYMVLMFFLSLGCY